MGGCTMGFGLGLGFGLALTMGLVAGGLTVFPLTPLASPLARTTFFFFLTGGFAMIVRLTPSSGGSDRSESLPAKNVEESCFGLTFFFGSLGGLSAAFGVAF